MDPALQELIKSTPKNQDIEVILKLSDEHQFPPGVKIITQFGNIVTCRIKRESIKEVWSSESVTSVKAPRYLDSEPIAEDFSEQEIITKALETNNRFNGTHQVTGQGVIVAILDWGCDFAHPNFCNEDGSTRLLALWDQSAALTSPNKYGYGQIYTRDDINRALATKEPYASLGYHPAKSDSSGDGTHGTAVMDIAAGNGLVGNSPMGIAPEADLIFVHLDAGKGTSGLLANLGDSVRLLEALDFVVQTAGEQPWVANLSLGRTGGEHTGKSLVEQGMDELLSAAPSRAIVQSTGNYYQTRTHSSDRLLPNQQHSLGWLVSPTDVTPNELEIWYPGSDRFLVKLRPPNTDLEISAALDQKVAIKIDGDEVGRLYHRAQDPNNGDNHIDIFLDRHAPSGRWQVTLMGEDIVDGRFHAWIERDFGRSTNQSRFELADAVSSYTTNTICNGRRTIAVGAYDQNSLDFEVAPFSSSGPTRDGRLKPDILAPGVGIVAARSTAQGSLPGTENLTIKSGTSFAAPQVTGAIALLFAAVAPRKLNIIESRNIVLSSADKAQNQEPWRVGNGYLNIKRMLDFGQNLNEVPINQINQQATTNIEQELSMNSQDIDLEAQEPTTETLFDEELPQSSTTNFILLSGGPGLYDNRDVEHDRSWANYVTPPLLLTSSFDYQTRKTKVDPEKLKQFENGQEVWWLVYRPAYIRRWEDDIKRKSQAPKDVKKEEFDSYLELLESRAKDRGWNLRWFDSADHLWILLKTFNDPIARVWYWGHARNGLWLSLAHSSRAVAVAPNSNEIITVASIKSNASLKKRFQVGNSSRVHRFIGCNTTQFAQTWAKTFGVYTEGFQGQIDFSTIHKTDGEPTPVPGAKLKKFSATGRDRTTEELEATDVEESKSDLVSEEVFDNLKNQHIDEKNSESSLSWEVVSHSQVVEADLEPQLEPTIYQAEIDLLSEGLNLSKSINPVQLYDSLQFGKSPAISSELFQQFEVIAYPGERLEQPIQEGDIIVRRALGEPNLGYVAVIAEANLWSKEEIATTGLIPESNRAGSYAHIIDEGLSSHTYTDSFARLIVEKNQRVPNYQILLRPKNSFVSQVSRTIAEQTATPPSPRIRSRPCCILASRIPLGTNIIDLSNIGNHNRSDENNGLIYSGKAGFLDTGHIRELCDLTKHIYDQIAANNGSPTTIKTLHGEAVFNASLMRNIWLDVARAIAYDDSVGYEIYTYQLSGAGRHNSSFSPEDLCSNFLGTLVAKRAILAGGGFNTEVTQELNQLIRDLDGQNQAESLKAFNLIKKRWVDFNSAASVLANDYLQRRNFSQVPWKTGHSSDSSTPAWVTTPLPNYSYYHYTHTAGRSIPKSRFSSEIASIRLDAKKRYGANYDRP